MAKTSVSSNRWRFFRAGGFDQVRLDTGADLMSLDQLDLKLWVALACPTSGLEFDRTTLDLIDTDKDGRVRAPELIAAVKWAGSVLKNPDDLVKGSQTLPLAAVNDAQPEGQAIATFARKVLGKADSDAITIEEATAAAQTFASKPFNGDGIVTVESTTDESVKAVINDIIACLGADTDASGTPGVGKAKVDQFFADVAAYSEWWMKGEGNTTVLPLGLATAAAASAVRAIKAKVDDFFARCRLAAFDSRALSALNREEKEYLALAAKDLTVTSAEIAGFPLARISSTNRGEIPLVDGINPAWAAQMGALQTDAVLPLLGDQTSLTEADWQTLLSKLAAYESWSGSKAGGSVEKLGLKRIRQILASDAQAKLADLIAQDIAEESSRQAITDLKRLVYYQRDLSRLCHNFVSFRDFYGRKQKAIFQAGTLFLDQRSCDLCLTVEDVGRHASMAALAGTYLAYCDCFRKGTGEKMQIVAAFTGGDSDNLMVGRNGIFFDRKGRDWDATVTKIVDNPISLGQAFFAPYKKLVRMIEEQIAKRAAASEAQSDAQLTGLAKTVAGTEPPKPGEPPKSKFDTGTLAAIGLVLTTLLAALGGIFGKFLGLAWWQMPLAVLGIVLAISAPSMLIACMKLRKRNLGPILDANGWAVNARAKINVPFGGSLTGVASLPPGSQRDLADPFAEKKSPWPALIVMALIVIGAYVVLDKLGYIHEWTQGRLGKPKAVQQQQPEQPRP
ncbi:MAG: hypothetical protein AB9869_36950 [Verrucomicrobiia bacterium]